MGTPEILAPVGGVEQLYAAVRCGANAVYLGTKNFNARRNAGNFGGIELKEAVTYCRVRNVRVYATLNTLVFDSELAALDEEIKTIVLSGADAVIVQDLAVMSRVKAICPAMPLHASTQMAVHNIAGVRELEELGFQRAVLARELTLNEIEHIRENTKIELECFVHGAHCMSVSGMCYFSVLRGERSGNRGLCAQPCRLPIRAGERAYVLSLKDMSLVGHLNELTAAGIAAFKIEGRMKRPEYVAAAVTACKNASVGRKYDIQALQSVFSRGGFTDGYFTGRRTGEMFGTRTKEDVTAASGVLKTLSALYEKEPGLVPVAARFEIKADAPVSLTLVARGQTVTVTGEFPKTASGRPLTTEDAARFLRKTGGTPFVIADPLVMVGDNLVVSAAAQNALRREGLRLLEEKLSENTPRVTDASPPDLSGTSHSASPALRLRVERFLQLPESIEAEYIYVPCEELLRFPERTEALAGKLIAELPVLIFPGSEELVGDMLCRLKALGITRAASGNIGGVRLLREAGLTAHGQAGLNIVNTLSLNEYAGQGLSDTEVSFELSMRGLSALGGSLRRGYIGYGYLPLMRLRACPVNPLLSCGKCGGKSQLVDDRNARYTVLCHNKAYMTLLNTVPLYLGDKKRPAADFVTLYFTVEDDLEVKRVIALWQSEAPLGGSFTRGPAYREIR